jgi:Ca2+-binding EF-hand superfamily protein
VSAPQNGNRGGVGSASQSDLMERLRAELKRRGASGMIGIQRKFRIIDDDGDKTLSVGEFTKAMRETGLNFSQEVSLLY